MATVAPEIQNIADKIWPMLERGCCVAWIGSGLSQGIYASWPDIMVELCERCSIPPLTDNEKECPDNAMSKAQECKEANREAYERVLADEYGHPIYRLRPAYDLLNELPFQTYVTTNFDPLLARGKQKIDVFPILNAANLKEKNHAFYLHGMARDGDTPRASDLVFAKDDFDFAYGSESFLPGFLDQLFAYQDVLFIGSGIHEPQIQRALTQIFRKCEKLGDARPGYKMRDKYILLKEEYKIDEDTGIIGERDNKREEEEEAKLNELGINVIRYAVQSPTHYEIEEILMCLCDRAKISVPGVPTWDAGQEVPLSGR